MLKDKKGGGKVKKHIILTIFTFIFILLICNAVAAADTSNENSSTLQTQEQIQSSYNSTNNGSNTNSSSQGSTSGSAELKNITISGKVERCTSGEPFPGVTITVKNNGTTLASTTTKEDGTYTLNFQSIYDIFQITASSTGHNPSTKEITVTSGQNNSSYYGVADFKLGADHIYIDDDWAGLPNGRTVYFPGDPNPHVIGSDAFATIRDGISNVNANGTIHIANGTYTGNNNRGRTIDKNLSIIGESRDSTIIDAGSQNRIFTIQSGRIVTISNLTIIDGSANDGGAISNQGTLTINNCTFTSNIATGSGSNLGGAIYNTGTLTVTSSTFTSNAASSSSNYGGAIYSTGTLTITSSTFTSNTAINGGAIYNTGSSTVTGSTFTNNTAISGSTNDAFGGAIYSTGTLVVTDSTFTNNSASSSSGTGTDDGGAIAAYGSLTVTNSTFTGNTATDDGGAICIGNESTSGMNVAITNSTFTSNHASYGGALWNNGGTSTNPEIITGSTFTSNSATYGGVIRNWGILTITNSNFTSNSATYGGAINNNQNTAVLTVTGSNFTGNSATYGGALYNTQGTVEIHFNRIVGNTGTDVYRSAGTVNAQNNWWGNNFQGSNPLTAGRVNSGVNVPTWLVLNITASPSLIHVGGTSTVTADLTHDQNGNYYNPVSGHVPDGILITFTGTLGTIPNASTVNGIATTTFTAGAKPGIATVNATLDSQTVNTQITVGRDDVYVSPTGNDTTGDGSQSNPLRTITAGIAGVYPGGTIHITNGTYNEHDLTINKDMTIVGESAASTIINAQQLGSIFDITSGIVTISNITLANGTATGNGGAINNAGTLTMTGSNFLNNTATGAGSAIYNTGTVEMHFNRILGTGNVIASPSGSVNAINNWWGSNSSPAGKVTGSVSFGPWIVLKVNANTTQIPTGGNSTITADLTWNSDNVQPTGGHIPDGTPVTFNVINPVLGVVNPVNAFIVNGLANSTFTGLNNGLANITATVDSEVMSVAIGIGQVNLSVNNYPWKTSTYTYNYKQQIVWLVQVNNLGTTDATGITVKYTIGNAFKVVGYNLLTPGTLTFDNATNTFTWTIDKLDGGNNTARGSYAGFSVLLESLRVGSGGSDFSLNSTIESCDQNNIGTTKTRIRNLIINPSADIQVNQTVSNINPNSGDYVTITVKVKNNGPSTATGVNINDLLPTGLYLNPVIDPNTSYSTTQGTYDPVTGLWTIGTLNNGTEVTLTITARVTADPGTSFSNRAYKSGTPAQYDWNTGNDSYNVIFNVGNNDVNLSVNNYPWKTSTYTYSYKQQIVWLVQVNNMGNTDATGITVKYTIGNAFKVVSYNLLTPGTLTFDNATNTFTWTINRLDGGNNTARGSYAGFSLLLESLKTGSGGSDFSLNSTIISCDQNNIGATKTRIRNLIINPSADIQVNQTVSNINPQQGDYITITVKVKNNGPNTATGITINDLLPAGLTVDSDPNTSINYSAGTFYNQTNGNWTIDNLTNGAEVTLTITARVDAASGTLLTTRAYKSGTPAQYDWNTGNDSDEKYIKVK